MITFVGHFSKDINIAGGEKKIVPGGGAFYGAFAARSLKENVKVITKVKKDDIEIFSELSEFGADVVFLESKSTTSIENIYPSSNPDERISRVLSLADPFTEPEVSNLEPSEKIHITPLWYGEFPEKLIPIVRERAKILSSDAQGFIRHVEEGQMVYKDWKDKEKYLPFFDVFKMDVKEAKILTGYDAPEKAAEVLFNFGVKEIVITMSEGVFIKRMDEAVFEKFGDWKFEGRTGRGDTCIAAYLVMREKTENLKELARVVAEITTKKMQKAGPYRGW